MRRLGKLVGATYVAGAVALFYCLCRRMLPKAALPATVLLGLGTCLWSVASQSLWMHGPATFWLVLALYLLLGPPHEPSGLRAAWIGLSLGMAVLTRPTTSLFLLATASWLLLRRNWRASAGMVLGSSVPVLGLLLYNTHYFGEPVAGGYGAAARSWETPLWIGLPGTLFAPSRGLFVYSPALLLAPCGILSLRRIATVNPAQRALVFSWLAAAAATTILYAKFTCWWGGWCFGPRFLCEILPLACLFFAVSFDRLSSTRWERVTWILIAFSVTVHFLGVFGHHSDWNRRQRWETGGLGLFSCRDTQITAHALYFARRIRSLWASGNPTHSSAPERLYHSSAPSRFHGKSDLQPAEVWLR